VVSKFSKNHQFHERANKNPTILGGYLIFSKELMIMVIYNNQAFGFL
jgi:hypothetical protein